MRYPTFLLGLLSCLVACGGDEPCPTGQIRIGETCVNVSSDSGVPDSSAADMSASEVCNGLDDDRDGMVDEADPMLGEACGIDMGVCTVGATVCTEGALVCDGVQASDETCNGLDDDCDGDVDEDAEQDFYLDVDGDGYGTGDACTACAPEDCGEELWVTMDGDCDETCDTCFPGGTEVCDGLDNDCNLLVDDGDVQTLLYEDTDGDGYGAGPGTLGCLDEDGNAPAGSSAEDGDCGPDDDRAFPGNTYSYSVPMVGPNDGLAYDYNCDGEEFITQPRCDTDESGIVATCAPLIGENFCWIGGAEPECGDAIVAYPTLRMLNPSTAEFTCRLNGDPASGDLRCR